jgi:hypothetical protein
MLLNLFLRRSFKRISYNQEKKKKKMLEKEN